MRLRTLGGLSLVNGGSLPAERMLRRQQLALLAVLAAHRAGLSRDRLLALLWPEFDTERARGALRQLLYEIRRDLRGPELIVGTTELTLSPAELSVDLWEFEDALGRGDAAGAVASYGGPFLDGFHVPDAPALEEWIEATRERLQRKHTEALEIVAREASEAGDHAAAIAAWRQRSTIDRLDARVAQALMRALAAAGDRTGALQHARLYDALVREELAIGPDPQVLALAKRIEDDPLAFVPATTAAPAVRTTAGVPEGPAERASPAADALADVGARGPASDAPDRSPTRHRRLLALTGGGVLLVAATVAATVASRREDDSRLLRDRVLVTALENQTGDSTLNVLGALAADWISLGLQSTDMVKIVDPATAYLSTRDLTADSIARLTRAQRETVGWPLRVDSPRARAMAEATRAGTVVWGAFSRAGDSLRFVVKVSDVRKEERLATIEVAGPSSSRDALLNEVRERVAGALAQQLDPRLASLTTANDRPPRLDAYRRYAEGLERFAENRYLEAASLFEGAASLDSAFMLPRFWAIFAYGNGRRAAKRDSLVVELVPLRDRLSPLDQASLDYFVARHVQGDGAAALHAVQRAAALAPQSNWTYMEGLLLRDANRPRAALLSFDQLDPERGWAKGWDQLVLARNGALHILGRFDEELEATRRARRQDPTHQSLLQSELLALAALGRERELLTLLDSIDALPPPMAGQRRPEREDMLFFAAVELLSHGHARSGQSLLARTLTLDATRPDSIRAQPRAVIRRAHALYALGRLAEAERATHARLAAGTDSLEGMELLGLIASAQRRAAEVKRVDAWLAALASRDPRRASSTIALRGELAGVMGDRERAVRMLNEALASGGARALGLHHRPLLKERMRGYPPFEEILHPKG